MRKRRHLRFFIIFVCILQLVLTSEINVNAVTVFGSFVSIRMPESKAIYNGFVSPFNLSYIPDDAIYIKTVDDLNAIRNESSQGKYYVLDNDIYFPDGYEWTPIDWFEGVFDGRGYNIINLNILEESNIQYAGLFGFLSGTNIEIKNVGIRIGLQGISASDSNYSSYAGGLIGHVSSFGEITVNNCYVTGNISAISSSNSYSGGLIGYISILSSNDINMANCYTTGKVSSFSERDAYVGGLIGSVFYYGDDGDSVNVSVTDCFSTANVEILSQNASAGGLIGNNFTANSNYSCAQLLIANCYATGNINIRSSLLTTAGGLIGNNFIESSSYAIINVKLNTCYASGNINIISSMTFDDTPINIGGLIGSSIKINSDNSTAHLEIKNCFTTGNISKGDISTASGANVNAGGLIGFYSSNNIEVSTAISDCYTTGNIIVSAASSKAGGIVGLNNSDSIITNCYASGEVISIASTRDAYAGGIIGYSTGMINQCVVVSQKIYTKNLIYPDYAYAYAIGYLNNDSDVTEAKNLVLQNLLGDILDDSNDSITINIAKTESIYTGLGWNFNTTWTMVSGYDYPQLVGEKFNENTGDNEGSYEIKEIESEKMLIGVKSGDTVGKVIMYFTAQGQGTNNMKLLNSDSVALKANDNVGTGTKIMKGSELIATVIIYGDIDGDGEITSADATLILRYIDGLESLSNYQKEAARVRGSSGITKENATLILRYIVGLVDELEP